MSIDFMRREDIPGKKTKALGDSDMQRHIPQLRETNELIPKVTLELCGRCA